MRNSAEQERPSATVWGRDESSAEQERRPNDDASTSSSSTAHQVLKKWIEAPVAGRRPNKADNKTDAFCQNASPIALIADAFCQNASPMKGILLEISLLSPPVESRAQSPVIVASALEPGASRVAALFSVRPSPSSPKRRRHSDLRSKAPPAFKGAACRLAACPVFACAPVQGIRIRRPMLTTSAMNSLMPCFESCDTLLTAISNLDSGSTPLYTLPNPPTPSRFLFLNPSVAWNKSLYENRCGPNSTSQSSRTSVYRSRLRTSRTAMAPTDKMNAAVAVGGMISTSLARCLGAKRGSFGSLVTSMAGAGPSMAKLQPRT
ncbi:hypothetical protein EJB05_14460, partial [Eragrostis curvula]